MMTDSEHAKAKELGNLYEELERLLVSKYEKGARARELSRLIVQYGADDVAWMAKVVAEDRRSVT